MFRQMNFFWSWRRGEIIEPGPQYEIDPELTSLQQELRDLKRALRDLVALSIAPAAWVGRERRDVASGLLELLFSSLLLDAAYVRLDADGNEPECELLKPGTHPEFAEWINAHKGSLNPRTNLDRISPPVLLPQSAGGKTLRVQIRAIGIQVAGVVLVASTRPDFPTEQERLLLSVAANQAATALLSARLSLERASISKELRESELQFRTLANMVPQLIWMANADGDTFWYNQCWYDYTGTTPQEVEGWGWQNVHDPKVLPTVVARWKASIETGEPFEMTFPLRGKDGIFRPFLTRAVPLRDEVGHIIRWFGTNTDVSPQANVENQLRVSQERLNAALAASQTGTFRWDPYTGEFLDFDENLKTLFGFDSQSDVDKTEDFLARVHPEDLGHLLPAVEACRKGADFEMEYRVVLPDGKIRWLYDRARMQWVNGRPSYLVGACTDITNRKQAEEVRHRLAAIVESSDDAIISKDLNGIITSWNKQAENLFGYTAQEMIGRSILTIIPPELHPDEDVILSKIRRGEKIEHFETVRVTKSGQRIEVSLSISPVRNEQGKIIGGAKIARNITEKKKMEQALRTTEKLAAAGRLAATVAHEINNPLEAVTNLVYLAKRDLPNVNRVAGHLDLAERELQRVAHIARQTLTFYRENSAPVRFKVSETIDELLILYEKRFEARSISLVRQYGDTAQITALAGEIRQALSNLISNAIDAMPKGGTLTIRVSDRRFWKQPDVKGVRVIICDTGSGIEADHISKLFQPFFTTKASVGTGLGLWITRNIIEKHRGTIKVRSRMGKQRHGTLFSIFLPYSQEFVANNPSEVPTSLELSASADHS